MEKNYSIPLIGIFTLAILFGLYFIQYPTKQDKLNLEIELQKFEEIKDIKIQKVEVIDNKIIALYIYKNGIGYGTFNKGLNGRCLLTSSHKDIGGITFQEGYINTKKGHYNLFAGKNYDNRIKSIELISEDGKRLIYDISKESYFVLTISNSTGTFSFLRFDLFDENGKSIKDEIIQKYLRNNTSSHAKAKMELGLFNFWYALVIFISSTLIYSKSRANHRNNISKLQ